MKKFILSFMVICLVSVWGFANEVQAESDLEEVVKEAKSSVETPSQSGSYETRNDYERTRKNNKYEKYLNQRGDGNNYEGKVVRNLALIIASTPLLTFGGWFAGFSSYLFWMTGDNVNQDTLINGYRLNWGFVPGTEAAAPISLIVGISLLTTGFALLLVGAIHLPRCYQNSQNGPLLKRLARLDRSLENLTIVSGVFSLTGLATIGPGVGLMCYGNAVSNMVEYGTGVALTVIGTIFSFIFVPIFASSLTVFCMNKKKMMTISPDVAVVHDNDKSFDEGYDVRLGLRITL